MAEGRPISADSPVYAEFRRLYDVAREMQPSDLDRWNGRLEAVEGRWGGLSPEGTMRLNERLVLDQLDPANQSPERAQALTTVYHETLHGRVPIDAIHEPNAYRGQESGALNEGLTEYAAVRDTRLFARAAGYGNVTAGRPEYPAAYAATNDLLQYAAGDGPERDELANRALAQPVVMRWDALADHVVQTRLDRVVPADPVHQQAARAELVNAMADSSWYKLDKVSSHSIGRDVAGVSIDASNQAIARIQQHYQQSPGQPYPSVAPNQAAPQAGSQAINGEQQRQFALPEMHAAFSGQAPAAGAVQTKPDLGNGSRSHAMDNPGRSIGPRSEPTDRGRD